MGAADRPHEQDDRHDHQARRGDACAPPDGAVAHGVDHAGAGAGQDQQERPEDLSEQPAPLLPWVVKVLPDELKRGQAPADLPQLSSMPLAPLLDGCAISDHLHPLQGPPGPLARQPPKLTGPPSERIIPRVNPDGPAKVVSERQTPPPLVPGWLKNGCAVLPVPTGWLNLGPEDRSSRIPHRVVIHVASCG